jgi:hypothetical protein
MPLIISILSYKDFLSSSAILALMKCRASFIRFLFSWGSRQSYRPEALIASATIPARTKSAEEKSDYRHRNQAPNEK